MVDYCGEARRLSRFDSEIVRAQSLGFEDVCCEAGAAKDNGGEGVKGGVALDPCEHGEAVHQGHLQIHQEQTWEWICLAIRVSAVALQIVNCFLTVSRYENRICNSRVFKRTTHEENVILIVLREKDKGKC